MIERFWVSVDFGGEHEVRQSSEQPVGGLWFGPFDNWTAARRHCVEAGVYEASEIQQKTQWWRQLTKDEAKQAGVLTDD